MIKLKCFMKYKGCESYTSKEGKESILYAFEDDEGHIEKFKLENVDVSELTEENIDKWFQCTFNHWHQNKNGFKVYTMFKSVTPVKENN